MGYIFHAEPTGETVRIFPEGGCYGDDFPADFHLKPTQDGTAWVEALAVRPPLRLDRDLHEAIDGYLKGRGFRQRAFARHRNGLAVHWRDLVAGRQWVDRPGRSGG